MTEVVGAIELVLRVVIVAALGYTATLGLVHWAVRSGRLQPFGALPRFARTAGDPALRPLERRLVRWGRNPQDAPLWLFGLVVLAGLLLLTLFRWIVETAYRLGALGSQGPQAWLVTLVGWAFGLVMIALIVRVVASWFGVSPYAPWMRPVVFLTEWILAPIRRRMPALGMFDLSPIVAYFALVLLRWLTLGILRAF